MFKRLLKGHTKGKICRVDADYRDEEKQVTIVRTNNKPRKFKQGDRIPSLLIPDSFTETKTVLETKRYLSEHIAGLGADFTLVVRLFTVRDRDGLRLEIPPHLMLSEAYAKLEFQIAQDWLAGLHSFSNNRDNQVATQLIQYHQTCKAGERWKRRFPFSEYSWKVWTVCETPRAEQVSLRVELEDRGKVYRAVSRTDSSKTIRDLIQSTLAYCQIHEKADDYKVFINGNDAEICHNAAIRMLLRQSPSPVLTIKKI